MVYNQELGFYALRQDTLSITQCYERFNTKVDVGEASRVNRRHKVLMEYVAKELYTQNFSALTEAEQLVIREDAGEHYLYYAFLRQSGTQHGNIKLDLQNDFTTGDNRYPKNCQHTLHFLDNYSNIVVQRTTQYK